MEALDKERPIAASRSHLIHASFQSPQVFTPAYWCPFAHVQPAWLYLDGDALERVMGNAGNGDIFFRCAAISMPAYISPAAATT